MNQAGTSWQNVFGLGAKAYSYLIDYGIEDKKAKSTRKCVIKRKLKFENCKNSFRSNSTW